MKDKEQKSLWHNVSAQAITYKTPSVLTKVHFSSFSPAKFIQKIYCLYQEESKCEQIVKFLNKRRKSLAKSI